MPSYISLENFSNVMQSSWTAGTLSSALKDRFTHFRPYCYEYDLQLESLDLGLFRWYVSLTVYWCFSEVMVAGENFSKATGVTLNLGTSYPAYNVYEASLSINYICEYSGTFTYLLCYISFYFCGELVPIAFLGKALCYILINGEETFDQLDANLKFHLGGCCTSWHSRITVKHVILQIQN